MPWRRYGWVQAFKYPNAFKISLQDSAQVLDALKMGFMRRQLRRIRGFGHGISDKSSARRHDGLHSLHNAVDFLHGEMFDCSVPNYARKWTVWESLPYVHDLVFNIGTLMEALRHFNS